MSLDLRSGPAKVPSMKNLLLLAALGFAVGCAAPETSVHEGRKGPISGAYEISNPKVKVKFQPPPPPYPSNARLKHISGDVLLDVTMNEKGFPFFVKAVSGPKELRQTAEHYLLNFEFHPVLINGVASEISFQFIMPFKVK